jgi:hypothetical protein
VFFGSFDWHSCVHGWWTLLTLRRLFPDMAEATHIAKLADETFTENRLAGELAYLKRPSSSGFERPYGWGWLFYLHLEATRHGDRPWAKRLAPLAGAFAARFSRYLDVLTYPIRTGTHGNTAFALVLALEWAEAFDEELTERIRSLVPAWFAGHEDCQAWEPGGDEFLSPALMEALAMVRCLPQAAAAAWLDNFFPRLAAREPASLFVPATVSDRSDGKIAHLDGLNLRRAWCWRALAPLVAPAGSAAVEQTAAEHLAAALPHVTGDYMGEHWLASFALLALGDARH